MDSVLASMEERARTAVIAENPDLTEEQITEAATLMLPRRTPTQLALLPRRPGDPAKNIFSSNMGSNIELDSTRLDEILHHTLL